MTLADEQWLDVGDSNLADGCTLPFSFRDPCGLMTDGFVLMWEGALVAFVNRCPHQPLTLDYGDGEFLDEENRLLLCRNHGALFEPATGKCVDGPCLGAHLERLEVKSDESGRLIVRLPSAESLPDLE